MTFRKPLVVLRFLSCASKYCTRSGCAFGTPNIMLTKRLCVQNYTASQLHNCGQCSCRQLFAQMFGTSCAFWRHYPLFPVDTKLFNRSYRSEVAKNDSGSPSRDLKRGNDFQDLENPRSAAHPADVIKGKMLIDLAPKHWTFEHLLLPTWHPFSPPSAS